MAEPIQIKGVQEPNWKSNDNLDLKVDGNLQVDRITPWGQQRDRHGYGAGNYGRGGYGQGPRPGYGAGPYGRFYGWGVDSFRHDTTQTFVAADYSLELRHVDLLGNESAFSAPQIIKHRPRPPAPVVAGVDSDLLSWTWSDP